MLPLFSPVSKTNSCIRQIEIFTTRSRGVRTAFVHRGHKNQRIKVPCSCFKLIQLYNVMLKDAISAIDGDSQT